MKHLLVLIIGITFSFSCLAQFPFSTPGEQVAVFKDVSGAPFGFYEYLPIDFELNSGKVFPVVFYFHGLGELGNGNSELYKVLENGPPKLIKAGNDYPSIIISPQAPGGFMSSSDFLKIYDYVTQNYPIDLTRVYITGLSAGGGGTWNALKEHYSKIAAAVPICGAGDVPNPSVFLQNTPIWTFHCFDDLIVPAARTVNNVNHIANTKASVMSVYPYGIFNTAADKDITMMFDTVSGKWSAFAGTVKPESSKLAFTLYKSGGHDAWSKTYKNQDMWNWLFGQQLGLFVSARDREIISRVYPNPTSGQIWIESTGMIEKDVEIYNVIGKKLYFDKLTKNNIDLGVFGTGIYFVRLISKEKNETLKVIVQ